VSIGGCTTPVLRTATMTRKASTNRVTTGGRGPAVRLLARTTPTPATSGASRTTRLSLTTTAKASAAAAGSATIARLP
jgi:hypothetical protein